MSAFDFAGIELRLPSIVTRAAEKDLYSHFDARTLRLVPCQHEHIAKWEADSVQVNSQNLMSLPFKAVSNQLRSALNYVRLWLYAVLAEISSRFWAFLC